MDQPKKYTRPPNKSKPAGPGKLPEKLAEAKVLQKVLARPPIIAGGTMTVTIEITGVTITFSGPIVKVLAILNLLFGSPEQQAVIARLQVKFGPEVPVK